MAQGYNMALLDKASVFKCLHKSKDQKEQKLLLFFSYSFIIATGIYSPEKIISVKIDRIDLLAVQRTLRSLLQHHSWKASILWHSAFFTVQLSQPYVTTGRTPVCLPYLLSYEVTSNISNINAKYKRH